MDIEKPKKISLMRFVLSDKRFTFLERAEYVLFLTAVMAVIAWLLFDIIRALYINPYAIITGAAVMAWMIQIRVKYIDPYYCEYFPKESAGNEPKTDLDVLTGMLPETGTLPDPSALPYLVIILVIAIAVAATVTFHWPAWVFNWTVIGGAVAAVLVTLKWFWDAIRAAWNNYKKAQQGPYGKYRAAGVLLFWILLFLGLGLAYWRYTAFTGR